MWKASESSSSSGRAGFCLQIIIITWTSGGKQVVCALLLTLWNKINYVCGLHGALSWVKLARLATLAGGGGGNGDKATEETSSSYLGNRLRQK